ncbi:MAG: protein kinase [Planctomycetales bacterium]|nr:protein kinase [Planctomycetales bacterium]
MSEFDPFAGLFNAHDEAHEAAIDAFEAAWEESSEPSLSEHAANVGVETLLELIHVDLERRLRSGLRSRTEHYLEAYPEVAAPRYAVDLIVAEFCLRSKFSEAVSVAEFVERFPDYRSQLMSRLADAELRAVLPAEKETVLMPCEQTGGAGNANKIVRGLPQIPGHETEQLIAAGGMGCVYKARDTELQRIVAIKVPREDVFTDRQGRDRFFREARAAAKLRHPNICPIYQIGDVGGMPYITMGFVSGCTLKEFAKRGLNPRQAAAIVSKLAHAVDYAHRQQVLHRDIKPANVLIDENTGEPILTDFGLAKELADLTPDMTQTGQVMGTPAYMAPEQAAGVPSAIGPVADVYSLGAVLFELLAGRPPLIGTVASILAKLQQDSIRSPRKYAPGLHRDLETICMKALAHLPTDRYGSAAALAEDLDRFERGDAILAKPDGFVSKSRRVIRRHPVSAVLLALLVVGSVTISGVFVRAGQRAARVANLRTGIIAQALAMESADLSEVLEIVRQLDRDLKSFREMEPVEADSRLSEVNAALVRLVSGEVRSESLSDSDMTTLRKLVHTLRRRGETANAERLGQQIENAVRGWVEVYSGDLSENHAPDSQARIAQESRTSDDRENAGADSLLMLPVVTPTNARLDVRFAGGWDHLNPPSIAIGMVDGHREQLECIRFAPDGRLFAACDALGTPRVWIAETMRLDHSVSVGLKCRELEFSADGKRLLISADSPGYALWDVDKQMLVDSGEQVGLAAIAPDRSQFAIYTIDRTITVKSMDDARTLQQFRYIGHGPISVLLFSERNTLFVLDWNGRVSEWDPTSGKELQLLYEGGDSQPTFFRMRFRKGADYYPQQQILVATWIDGTTRVWKAGKAGSPLEIPHSTEVRCFDVSSDGRWLLTSAASGPVYIWDMESGQRANQVTLGAQGTNLLQILPSATQFLASTAKGVSRWTFDGERLEHHFEHLTTVPLFTCHFPTSRLIAADDKGRLHAANVGQSAVLEVEGAVDYELSLEATGDSAVFNASLARAGTTVHSAAVRLNHHNPLSLRLQRLDGHVQAWIDDSELPLLGFHEVFPAESDPSRRFAITRTSGTVVEHATAFEPRHSKTPSVWQFAGKYYAQGEFGFALDHFLAARSSFAVSALESPADRELWQEATFKSADCLLRLQREPEAVTLLEELCVEVGEQWPAFAMTRLFALALKADDVETAEGYLKKLQDAGWEFRRLVAAVPANIRDELAQAAYKHFELAENWYSFDPQRVVQLQRRVQVETLMNGRPNNLSVLFLLRALRIESRDEEAMDLCRKYSRLVDEISDADLIEELAWILREHNDTASAIALLNQATESHPQHKHQFNIELARAEIADGDLEAALRRCETTLEATRQLVDPSHIKCHLHLIRGFILSDLRRPEEAKAAWKEGFYLMFATPTGEPTLAGAAHWTLFLLLGSLSGELTPEDLEPRVAPMIRQFTAGTALGSLVHTFLAGDAFLDRAKLFSKKLFGAETAPQSNRSRLFAERMLSAWQTDNGRILARRIAYLQVGLPNLIRDPALLMACEVAQYMARPQGLSDNEEILLQGLAREVYDHLLRRKTPVLREAMPAIGIAWQTTPASSIRVLSQLETLPDIQAPLAYFFGLRCSASGNTSAARQCFIQAQKSSNPTLAELAAHELSELAKE